MDLKLFAFTPKFMLNSIRETESVSVSGSRCKAI
jgi:hypothetical protein